jgi:hypothetical protein
MSLDNRSPASPGSILLNLSRWGRRLLWRFARLAAIITLLWGTVALVAATTAAAAAAPAAPAAAQNGWVRIAHLSPEAPAMDIYLYPFGSPGHPTVLKDVSYGKVSDYMAVSPGQYTVAMRGFGAPASSTPALASSFTVSGRTAYTVAAIGPDPGLQVKVLKDQMSPPVGKTLVRVIQASLKEHLVTVSYGPHVLVQKLAFGAATSYTAISPGVQTVQFTASGEHTAMSVKLTADTVHTIVVLDDSSGLKVDTLMDAAGSQIMPKGGAATGLGGTALRRAVDPVPWLLTIAAGVLLTAGGFAGLRRSRHTAAAGHKYAAGHYR